MYAVVFKVSMPLASYLINFGNFSAIQ